MISLVIIKNKRINGVVIQYDYFVWKNSEPGIVELNMETGESRIVKIVTDNDYRSKYAQKSLGLLTEFYENDNYPDEGSRGWE